MNFKRYINKLYILEHSAEISYVCLPPHMHPPSPIYMRL